MRLFSKNRAVYHLLGLSFVALLGAGCQSAVPTVSNHLLLAHLPCADFSGLDSMKAIGVLNVNCSLPDKWTPLKLDRTPLYVHQQWKSRSGHTGVGVFYVHMPFPFSAKTLLWFAKSEYSKHNDKGHALNEWTDALGRPWFEAENDKYHVRGYAVTDGFQAWIVYCGYKTIFPPNAAELQLAARCMDTVVPQTSDVTSPAKPALADLSNVKAKPAS